MTLYIIVPCYNEEDALPESARILRQKLHDLAASGAVDGGSRLMLVDDGSADGTWSLIERLCAENENICGVKLSCNRGHQNALVSGLVTALRLGADWTVTIDADLQDDPDAIERMVSLAASGADVVCGVRSNRDSDGFLKRFTAHAFYIAANICGAKLIYDHADFRLLSARAVDRLLCYGTDGLFLRGLVTRLGFEPEKVRYERRPRAAGESKYTLRKMLALAAKGFSVRRMERADTPQIGKLYIEKVLT